MFWLACFRAFNLFAGTKYAQTQTSEPPFEFPRFNPQLQPINDSISLEKDLLSNEMDIDWVGLSNLILVTLY
jgi:hypothetical protein